MPTTSSSSSKRARLSLPPSPPASDSDDEEGPSLAFTQDAPSFTQSQHPSLPTDKDKEAAHQLKPSEKAELVKLMSRYLFFQSSHHRPVTRKGAADAAMKEFAASGSAVSAATARKVASVVFDEARAEIKRTFGYELVGSPPWMERSLPAKYKDRYYFINNVRDASHAVSLHSGRRSAENGLLMLALCMVYNKGAARTDTERRSDYKWLTEEKA
ncbi:hypothetical protein TeGR_g14462, partial [Tetraparma gracilis]